METGIFWALQAISDHELRCALTDLLARGYRTEARIVAHIAEVEARKLYAKDGCSSLFEYCLKQLGLSESEAFHRLTAARIASQFPIVFAMIERREIHLTAVCLLRDYLTIENHRELLAEASHKSKWQVKELLARRFPRPDVPSFVRRLPAVLAKQASTIDLAFPVRPMSSGVGVVPNAPKPELSIPNAVGRAANHDARDVLRCDNAAPANSTSPAQTTPATSNRAVIEPLSEARYRIQLNASATLKEKLELFQALVSHSIPNGDVAAALERALDLALEQVQKRRFGQTRKPRKLRNRGALTVKTSSLRREHVPNATRRELVARDGLRCSYVGEGGCRCSERVLLQIHHEEPWARGGSSASGNLRLLCAVHNRLLAERDFGAEFIAERVAARQRDSASSNRAQPPSSKPLAPFA